MIYVFLANGFEEIEAIAAIDVLRRAELDVVTVGVPSSAVMGSHGLVVDCDIYVDMVEKENCEMIVLPGGMPGTLNLAANSKVKEMIEYMNENNRYIGAICAAPSILGQMGLLDGKVATCFPGFEEEMGDAIVSKDSVCVDGNIITAKGAGVAVDFGLTLVSMFDERKSVSIRKAMQCK